MSMERWRGVKELYKGVLCWSFSQHGLVLRAGDNDAAVVLGNCEEPCPKNM